MYHTKAEQLEFIKTILQPMGLTEPEIASAFDSSTLFSQSSSTFFAQRNQALLSERIRILNTLNKLYKLVSEGFNDPDEKIHVQGEIKNLTLENLRLNTEAGLESLHPIQDQYYELDRTVTAILERQILETADETVITYTDETGDKFVVTICTDESGAKIMTL